MHDPAYDLRDAVLLALQNQNLPCPSCGSVSGHKIKCATLQWREQEKANGDE